MNEMNAISLLVFDFALMLFVIQTWRCLRSELKGHWDTIGLLIKRLDLLQELIELRHKSQQPPKEE